MRLDRLYRQVAGGAFLRAARKGDGGRTEGTTPVDLPTPGMSDWVLVEGNRRVVAGLLFVAVYAVLLLLGYLWPFEIQTLLSEEVTVQRLFTTLLSGVILLVSIVVSINSLVVSQELAPIGNQHERVIASWEFRDRVVEAMDVDATPATPDEFLEQLIDNARGQLDELSSAVADSASDAGDEIRGYVEDAAGYLEQTREAVQKGGTGIVDVALFGPAYEPSAVLQRARQLRQRGSPDDAVDEALETVVEALQFFTTTREYFKTVYYKREFSKLSRDLLYTGLPAILLVSYVLLALDAKSFPGVTLGLDHLFMFVSFAYVVALSPFLTLTSYVLRAAIIAERTITAGAFVVE